MSSAQPPILLLTRPRPDSRRFAAMLPDWRAVIAPVLRIVAVDHDRARLRDAAGLVFTSAHAVGFAGPGRGRLALCVGGHTAQAARAAGFDVRQGNGFAEGLLPLIADAPVPLIHPHGCHLARELPVPGMVVYDQQPVPLTAQARDVLAGGAPVVLPLFSPRSARLVSDAVRGARAPLWPVAISDAALSRWSAPAVGRAVADAPDAAAMVHAIRRLPLAEQ
ncbi:uroporphyrinogen-III synthase [Paracoccus sediminis]|uniref:Uroporphyrinogen-III synthase n=1 Tax=Paracoccus sediminis TaxID=1214787 RepID=A0A238UNV0_9RHOB|nr:uroporphyrinogen-III synthase [Paracoccus sediminis]TBN53073.1 uroporphyrinogen-III synthase [Paracoccus sediminis]SNR23287.1 uroporphyrinogen-III synthase [Paracoccus sediminis]